MAVESVPSPAPRKSLHNHLAVLFPRACDVDGIDLRIALNACLYRAAATLKLTADDSGDGSVTTDAVDGAVGYIELAQALLDDLVPPHGAGERRQA